RSSAAARFRSDGRIFGLNYRNAGRGGGFRNFFLPLGGARGGGFTLPLQPIELRFLAALQMTQPAIAHTLEKRDHRRRHQNYGGAQKIEFVAERIGQQITGGPSRQNRVVKNAPFRKQRRNAASRRHEHRAANQLDHGRFGRF